MESIIHFLITPSAAMLMASAMSMLFIFVYVFSTSIPNLYFSYSGGDVRYDKNSSKAASICFASMVILMMQAVGFYALDYSSYFEYMGRVTVDNVNVVLEKFDTATAVAVTKDLVLVYVIGTFLSVPLFWKMLNNSYINTIRYMLKSKSGTDDYDKAVLTIIRDELFNILEKHTVVSKDKEVTGLYGAIIRPQSTVEPASGEILGAKGSRQEHTIHVDVNYLNSKLKMSHTAFSFSSVGEFTVSRLSSVNPLFSFISLPAENRKLYDTFDTFSGSVDNAIFLVNTAYVKGDSLMRYTQLQVLDLVKGGYAAPLPIAFFQEDSKAILSDVLNVIRSGKKNIALDPSVLANQVGIMSMNWPLFLIAIATYKIRGGINSVVNSMRTMLKAISENAAKDL